MSLLQLEMSDLVNTRWEPLKLSIPLKLIALLFSAKSVRAVLEKIIEARKEKGFKINWTEHLREIYQNYIKKDWTQ